MFAKDWTGLLLQSVIITHNKLKSVDASNLPTQTKSVVFFKKSVESLI